MTGTHPDPEWNAALKATRDGELLAEVESLDRHLSFTVGSLTRLWRSHGNLMIWTSVNSVVGLTGILLAVLT